MQRLLFFVLFFICGSLCAQNHIPDTSFTTYSAFKKAQKQYPFITIAGETNPPGVKKKISVLYAKTPEKKLYLDVVYPKNQTGKLPAVLLIFGGGWRSGDRSQNMPMAELLAKNGYVCVSPDYRLSTDALYPAAVYDLKNAVRWMKKKAAKYNIDTARIAVLGTSAGGQLAALLGTTNGNPDFDTYKKSRFSSSVDAVIDIDGVLAFDHPESGEVSTDPNKTSAAAYWFGGNLPEKAKLWHDASPLLHADKNTVPFLFLNSSLTRFHAGRDDMIEILKANKIYAEVQTFPDTPHTFWLFNPWFNQVMNHTIRFLNQQFKN